MSKFDDLTPRELAYILAMQGILASDAQMYSYPYEMADGAIKCVDALFSRIEQKRREQK